jgi:hypothetical protein
MALHRSTDRRIAALHAAGYGVDARDRSWAAARQVRRLALGGPPRPGRRSRGVDVGRPPVTHVRPVGHPVDRGEVLGTGGIGALGFDPLRPRRAHSYGWNHHLWGSRLPRGSVAGGFGDGAMPTPAMRSNASRARADAWTQVRSAAVTPLHDGPRKSGSAVIRHANHCDRVRPPHLSASKPESSPPPRRNSAAD